MKKSLLLLFFFSLALLLSCEKNECTNEESSLINSEVLPRTDNLRLRNIDGTKNEVGLVIYNSADYEKFLINDNVLPEIDFKKKFLLAARVSHPNCAVAKQQSVGLKCNKLVFNATTQLQVCTAPSTVFYFALVDVKYAGREVHFNFVDEP